jgi:hypothetical protein
VSRQECFVIVSREMWEEIPEIARKRLDETMQKHYPFHEFDIEIRYERNLFQDSSTVALIGKVKK